MLQDGARRNNYPAPKELGQDEKKSTAASAVLKPPKEDGGDFPFAIFLELVLALPAGFGSSGWPDR